MSGPSAVPYSSSWSPALSRRAISPSGGPSAGASTGLGISKPTGTGASADPVVDAGDVPFAGVVVAAGSAGGGSGVSRIHAPSATANRPPAPTTGHSHAGRPP